MFCTAQDVTDFLMIEVSDTDACERAIKGATAAIRNYCKQQLSLVANETITLNGSGTPAIILPQFPVVSIARVNENDVLLTTSEYKLGDHGLLYRVGRSWARGIQNIQIVYTHGYQTIPDDIVEVCTRAAARAYQSGLRAKDQNGVMGLQSVTIGDYQAGFSSESGGGVGEGVMGASSARLLLLSEKDILNQYKDR